MSGTVSPAPSPRLPGTVSRQSGAGDEPVGMDKAGIEGTQRPEPGMVLDLDSQTRLHEGLEIGAQLQPVGHSQ